MKIVIKQLLSMLAACIIFAGCASTGPQLFPSETISRTSPSIHPSLIQPKRGLHEYVGAAYGNNKSDIDEENEKFESLLLNGGLLLQPDVSGGNLISPFVGLSASLFCSRMKVYPYSSSASRLKKANLAYGEENTSFAVDGLVNLGLLVKYNDWLFMLYGQGIMQYEFGDYFQYRKQINGIGKLYNAAAKPESYGFGAGIDFQTKINKNADVGISIETDTLYNTTQSFDYYDSDTEIVHTKDGGVTYQMGSFKFEPYFDYRNIRVTVSICSPGPFYVGLTWRW